jgi:ribose transport system permease protein
VTVQNGEGMNPLVTGAHLAGYRIRIRKLAGLLRARAFDYGIVASCLVLFVTLSIASDVFLSRANLLNILDQQASLGIIACGITLLMIAGEFDLSVGSVFAIAAVLAAKVGAANPVLGLVTGVAVGTGFGLANGILVTVGRIRSFIATLATSIIIRGIAIALTGGFLVSVASPDFRIVGSEGALGLKYSIWLLVAVVIVTWFVLTRTTFGRYLFAVGGNAEAARLSGVRVNLVRLAAFAIAGFSAGVGGTIDVSRVGSAQSEVGTGLELTAIAAVVIGGTSIAGGEGAIWRTVLGVLLLAMIANGSNLLGIDPTYQRVFEGGLIVLAVSLDAWARRGRR